MRRILTTGLLLLILAGITWTFPGCDDGPMPVDTTPARVDPTPSVDTSASLDAAPVDTSAALPDASPDAA